MNKLEKLTPEYEYFYSLCRKAPEKKKVLCLQCGKKFSGSTLNKICSVCNGRKNYRAVFS